VIAGCGGGDDSSPAPAPGPDDAASTSGGDRVVVAALGDSITAGNPAFDPDPSARRALGFGDDERSQYEYWAEREDASLELRNCGVFGERTDEIALRIGDCAEGADALIVQGGINDIAQGVDPALAARQLAEIVSEGEALGLDVAIADVLPWNNGHPAADPAIEQLNRLIVAIGRDEEVPVLPFHDTLEDPAEPGVMRADWTADGDHPSVEGYRRLGEIAFSLPEESG